MTTVAIIGASGYAGAELVRLIHSHPEFQFGTIAAGSNAGATLASVHPQFASVPELASKVFATVDVDDLAKHDLVFMALPHGESAATADQLPAKVKVVDLGADFRLTSAAQWEKYYGGAHAGKWTYGLPELRDARAKIAASDRVANPGCYATAIQVGLAPLLEAELIDATDIIVVAASGTSGAGRSAKVNLLGSEVMGSMSTYKVGGLHQHTPEIEEALTNIAGKAVQVNFTPMLAPMPRGILATISVKTTATAEQLRASLEKAYDAEPFITVLPDGQLPVTASTFGVNAVHVQVAKDERMNRATIITALDNLIKGAAGQAVQNANIMFGLAENSGLLAIGIAP